MSMAYENLDDIVFALTQYEELLQKFPNDVKLLSGKAEILEGLDINDKINFGNQETVAILERAKCYVLILEMSVRGSSEWNKALKSKLNLIIDADRKTAFVAAFTKYDRKHFACDVLAEKIKDRKNLNEVEYMFDWLLEFEPNNLLSVHGKALAISQRNLTESLTFCDNYIQGFGEEFWPWYVKGTVLKSIGRHEEALKYFAEAQNKPNKVTVASAWSRIYFESARKNIVPMTVDCLLALGRHGEAIRMAPSNIEKAEICYKTRDYSGAKDFAGRAINENPNNPMAHQLRGHAYYGLKKYGSAADAYGVWVQLRSQNADAWYWLGEATMREDPYKVENLEKAVQCFETARKLGKSNIPDGMLKQLNERISVLHSRSVLNRLF